MIQAADMRPRMAPDTIAAIASSLNNTGNIDIQQQQRVSLPSYECQTFVNAIICLQESTYDQC